MREKKIIPLQKSVQSSFLRSFLRLLIVILLYFFSKKVTISVSLPCGWSSHRRETKDTGSAQSWKRGECPPTPASGMLASVRLNAHNQLEPHCCVTHSAGRECQLLSLLFALKYDSLIINLQTRVLLTPQYHSLTNTTVAAH